MVALPWSARPLGTLVSRRLRRSSLGLAPLAALLLAGCAGNPPAKSAVDAPAAGSGAPSAAASASTAPPPNVDLSRIAWELPVTMRAPEGAVATWSITDAEESRRARDSSSR